jgi:hypothetical protein
MVWVLAVVVLLGIAFHSCVGWLARGGSLVVRLIVFAVIAGVVIHAVSRQHQQ